MVNQVGGMDRSSVFLVGVALFALSVTKAVMGDLAIAAFVVGAIALVTGFSSAVPRGVCLESIPARASKPLVLSSGERGIL